MTTHLIHLTSSLTTCCHRDLASLPAGDRISTDPSRTTCEEKT